MTAPHKEVEKKTVARNKKAFADFEIIEKIESGIILTGAEIKSVRNGQMNLKGSYVHVENCEAWTEGIHISPYKPADQKNYDPKRKRKLLLKRRQIDKIEACQEEKGLTVIPLEVYIKKGFAKVLIGTARGKKKYDKRQDLKKRSQNLEIKRALKNFQT